MRRLVIWLLLASATVAAAGCGFGRADDTGLPIPGQYWGWVCPSGDAPDGDAGCPSPDGGTQDALPSLELRRL
jgi:outer membrane lipopolysaccharide assembly protein LptE/RlpB